MIEDSAAFSFQQRMNYSNSYDILFELIRSTVPRGPRPALVLDLDGTLIYSTVLQTGEEDFKIRVRRHNVYIHVRPGTRLFLECVSKYYNLYIFTASKREYGNQIINKIAPFIPQENRFFIDSCDHEYGYVVKDLRKLNIEIENTILIDDMAGSGILQPNNMIIISNWNGDKFDHVLDRELLPILLKNYSKREVAHKALKVVAKMNSNNLHVWNYRQ